MRRLYCPTGGTKSLLLYDSEIAEGHFTIMNEFDRYCQCKHGATCHKDWATDADRYDCSSFLSGVLENDYYVKSACYIHDMCYQSGRDKSSCDNEFHHNFKQLCYETVKGYAIGAGTGAGAAIGGTIAACAIPFINFVACPLAVASLPGTVTTGVAIGATWTNCPAMADIAYYAVRDHGHAHGYQCQAHHGDRTCS